MSETIRQKYGLEQYNPVKGEVVALSETYHSGIRKTLNYVLGSHNNDAWLFVQDDLTGDFIVDIPPKEEMPEGRNPYYYIDHCMLWSQRVGQRKVYS